MFAKTIIDSDAFVDMPLSTQALYFHLSMRADDDGFINNPKRIQRMIGCADDDLKVLIAKRFILPFDSGVVVIKHWKIHNYIRNDRYKETVYQDEKSQLALKENGAYTEADTIGIPSGNQAVYQLDTQVSIGKGRLGKDSIEVVEVSEVTDNCGNETEQIRSIGGKLGKGVIYLTQDQMDDLIEKLGVEAFDRYMEKLADFIIDKGAKVKNHYATILKWWREDAQMEE